MMKYRVNKMLHRITYFVTNVHTLFAKQGDYFGVGNEDIIKKAHLLPDGDDYYNIPADSSEEFKSNIHYWLNQRMSIEHYSGGAAGYCNSASACFHIRQSVLSSEECIALLTHDWSSLTIEQICVDGYDCWYPKNITQYNYKLLKNGAVPFEDAVNVCNKMNFEYDMITFGFY